MISFDARTHTYRHAGVAVPSVTQIIGTVPGLVDLSGIPPERLAHATRRGSLVHEMLRFDDEQRLNEHVLDERLHPYLGAWRAFCRGRRCRSWAQEYPVYHPQERYAGTIDRYGEMDMGMALLEIKSGGAQAGHAVQAAAYAEAFRAGRNGTVDAVALVYLAPGTGTGYRVKRVSAADLHQQYQYTFLPALRRWWAQHPDGRVPSIDDEGEEK
jgi:hypothetical protein